LKTSTSRAATSLLAFVLFSVIAPAQAPKSGPWEMQNSGTTAGLRGIYAVGGGVAWASGTNGTVLRTEDGGYMWQSCAMPPGAEKLDFRGVWARDAQTAIVMSSGPGDQSRLYKTTDGCSHWILLYTNPDKDGFWDAVEFANERQGIILGDPVRGSLTLLRTSDGGQHWARVTSSTVPGLAADPSSVGAFAASNSSIVFAAQVLHSLDDGNFIYWFGTGGRAGPYVFAGQSECDPRTYHREPARCWLHWRVASTRLPLASGSAAGVFSLAILDGDETIHHAVAVGGDYTRPDERQGTAAWWDETTRTWTPAAKPPGGYRSAVQIVPESASVGDFKKALWIAVGTNGSDISYDGGKTWQPLDSGNWNALSLPWAVGPHGRIGKLGQLPARK
jgi:hypothetical protein